MPIRGLRTGRAAEGARRRWSARHAAQSAPRRRARARAARRRRSRRARRPAAPRPRNRAPRRARRLRCACRAPALRHAAAARPRPSGFAAARPTRRSARRRAHPAPWRCAPGRAAALLAARGATAQAPGSGRRCRRRARARRSLSSRHCREARWERHNAACPENKRHGDACMSDIEVCIAALNVYPVKSCAGVALNEALLVETGLEFDRAWMVVDTQGNFVTQRELPRMALVTPTLRSLDMVLRAPGMLALHIALDTVETPTRVRVWDDEVAAYDMGDLAAQWFSDFVGRPLRLVRFDPEQRRLSSREWSGEIEAENAFADAFPLLVASTEGLAEVNRRLAAAGE